MINWEEILPKRMEICPSIKECNDCDILQCNAKSFILGVKLCIFSLKQAEKEGKICRMPSEEELINFLDRYETGNRTIYLSKAILDLLRGKK